MGIILTVIQRENLMKRCRICVGQKYVYGMGNMREKCKPCDGKGFMPEIKKEEAKTIPVSDATCVVFDEPPDPTVYNMNLVKAKKKENKNVGKQT